MPEFDVNPSQNQAFRARYNGATRNACVHEGLFCRVWGVLFSTKIACKHRGAASLLTHRNCAIVLDVGRVFFRPTAVSLLLVDSPLI